MLLFIANHRNTVTLTVLQCNNLKPTIQTLISEWLQKNTSKLSGASIPRKRPKKTRNPEKDQKKTEKDFIFNRIFVLYDTISHLILLFKPKYVSGVF